jgi:hypothetical protein
MTADLLLEEESCFGGGNGGGGYPQDGLIGQWLFDGNALDTSGNGWDATVNGATLTTDRHGTADSAYLLNGTSDYLEVEGLDDLSGNAISIFVWAKLNSGFWQSLVRQQIGGTFLVHGQNSGQDLFSFNSPIGLTYDTSPGVTDGNYHLFGTTWERNTLSGWNIYIDGDSSVTTEDASDVAIPDIGGNVFFGSFAGASEFFGGVIDTVLIYDRALTSSEIVTMYNDNKA